MRRSSYPQDSASVSLVSGASRRRRLNPPNIFAVSTVILECTSQRAETLSAFPLTLMTQYVAQLPHSQLLPEPPPTRKTQGSCGACHVLPTCSCNRPLRGTSVYIAGDRSLAHRARYQGVGAARPQIDPDRACRGNRALMRKYCAGGIIRGKLASRDTRPFRISFA